VAISHLIIDRLSHRPCCSGARSKQSLHEH
jgi:hypothetical protein